MPKAKSVLYIVKNELGQVSATTTMSQGETLVGVDELKEHTWLFDRFKNAIFIVRE
ncbi:hypothetical protein [Brevibacillus reuszeri]|uniref:hypothetical protein n=1 Tax=Brevibacillus reuszeri TaxID=54915 RepID=UPI003D241F69